MEKRNDLILSTSQRALISPSQRYSLAILEMSNIMLLEHVAKSLNENPFLVEENSYDTRDKNIRHHNKLLLENIPNPCSKKEEILQQFAFLRLNNTQKKIAITLMDHVIEHGYMNNDVIQKVSREDNISYTSLLKIIKKLQTLNPPALFSFNLQDKLKTLLEIKGKYDADHKTLIQNIDMVLSYGTSALKEKYNFNNQRLQKIIADIRSIIYDFGSYFDDECCQYRIPDIILENEDESSISNAILPQILIDMDLYNKSTEKCRSMIDKKYIKENLRSAKILIQSINNRNTTVLKIVKEIAYRQHDFLFGESSCLIPISVKSIANSLLLHESTINRAIANKTISTPKGIFELKSLMPRQIKLSECGGIFSDHTVKLYIKNLVDNEPKNSPYTDNHIVYFLNSRGIGISRRTVSKYRNTMNIPNASHRTRSYDRCNTV